MPIVAHTQLPTFASLRDAGEPVLTTAEALSQDIREIHLGLLNMMPDAALRVTEQQFMRLIGGSNSIVQIYVHVFTLPGPTHSAATQDYIDAYYTPFEEVLDLGLDALVVTGANPVEEHLEDESFYGPLAEVMEWATANVTSTLCSCLSSHAILQHSYGIHRRPLLSKRWGVFPHRNVAPEHPLLRGINTRYNTPHSRWNAVTPEQLRSAGLRVLAETDDGDFHIGTSADGFRTVFFQGHPEYDAVSLLKEYKREVDRHLAGEIPLPPFPENYLTPDAARLAADHVDAALAAADPFAVPFPEDELRATLDNTWTDTAKAIFNNWLGLVYRLTGFERGVAFMGDVDPDDPLQLGSVTG
ncbi:homoserine O-succinyltransferase MetA [Euzebya tangerina]|uniref:homoserine O-succinyltransferase MetA n=1 Tax=Euzebya tangerina TaxID=591198 RepID=UPI000E31469E|nr:homoserine O-succinyltransferase [Euzebya tangerina]